jgi:quercetin dioxygenase-like cupin family protein
MKIQRIEEMYEGWFIGDFEPTVCKTKDFEVCYKVHKKNEKWPVHYHKIATEINYLIRGSMTIQGKMLKEGDIFILEPGEIADPVFHENCELIVVKKPSVKDDKFEVR